MSWSITAIIKARANVARVPVMWVRVPGACAPELMVSSLGALKKAPNKPMIAASPPVMVPKPQSLDRTFLDLES